MSEAMNEKNKHWLLRKENIRKLWIGFIAILIATVLAGLFVHQQNEDLAVPSVKGLQVLETFSEEIFLKFQNAFGHPVNRLVSLVKASQQPDRRADN